MRLTSRGWTVLAVLAIATALSWQHGPRSLNAVVTPLLVVFVAGAILTARVDRPTVRRHRVENGSVGDTRTVEVTIEARGTISATVVDAVGNGLTASTSDGTIDAEAVTIVTTIAGDERIAYDVTLERRGEHVVGPVSITVTDVFGLVERRFSYTETTSVLAYPPVYELHSESAGDLRALEHADASPERESFDHLREYRRGDSLRDVNWKAAAKRPDDELVVTEYSTDERAGAITIAAECGPDEADQVACAVASVASHLLERDRRVGVAIGDEQLSPGTDHGHRRELLGLLAVANGGELSDSDRQDADVLVTADWRDVRIVAGERTIPFPQLLDEADRERASQRGRFGSGLDSSRRESGVIA